MNSGYGGCIIEGVLMKSVAEAKGMENKRKNSF